MTTTAMSDDDDRRKPGYQPEFDVDYKFGEQAELFIVDIIKALGTERVEVKHDAVFANTGNIYVEWRCLRGGIWQKSGIAATQAEFWIFVLHNPVACVVVRTAELRLAARERYRLPSHRVTCDRGSHPTEGVKIPLLWLLMHGTRMESAS
jgi:hypothetical protein